MRSRGPNPVSGIWLIPIRAVRHEQALAPDRVPIPFPVSGSFRSGRGDFYRNAMGVCPNPVSGIWLIPMSSEGTDTSCRTSPNPVSGIWLIPMHLLRWVERVRRQRPNPVSGIWLIPIRLPRWPRRSLAHLRVPIPFPVSGSFRYVQSVVRKGWKHEWSQSRFRYLAHSDKGCQDQEGSACCVPIPFPVSGSFRFTEAETIVLPPSGASQSRFRYLAHSDGAVSTRRPRPGEVPIPFPVSGSFRLFLWG